MKKIFIYALVLIALPVLSGCWNSKPTTAESETPPVSESGKNPPCAAAESSLSIQEEPPLPASALSKLPSVQETLEKMVQAYKNLDSYTDQASCRAFIRRGEMKSDQALPYSISYVAPNKFRFSSRTCEIRSDGKTISVFIPGLPGVILQKPCPPQLRLQDILFDQVIDEAVTISQASRFSVLPLQWVMLFAQDPLKTVTFGQKEIRMLTPKALNGRNCYRIRIERSEGPAVIWIDETSGLILRAQLPPEMLLDSVEGAKPDECSLTIDFYEAQVNTPIADEAFKMEIPVGAKVVDKYIPPTISLLGAPLPEFKFYKIDNSDVVTNEQIKGKIAVIDFWASWSKLSPSTQPLVNQLKEKFAGNSNVVFLSVSTDEISVSDAVLREAFKQWNVNIPIFRDLDSVLSKEMAINKIPALFLVNQNGVIEHIEMGFNPLLVNEISEMIQRLVLGESLSEKTIQTQKAEMELYRAHMKEWLDRGIFVDAQTIQQSQIPETSVAPPSAPGLFQLKELWTASAIQNPGGLQATDSASDDLGRVWTIENGKKIVEIDPQGNVCARYDLNLAPKEVCSFIRRYDFPEESEKSEIKENSDDVDNGKADSAPEPAAPKTSEYCFLAFAPGQQRIHVYDKNWKLMFHYPEDALDSPHDGIQDARFGELADGVQPEIYIGFLGTRGVQSIGMEGRLRWSNRALGTVYSIAPYHNQNENMVLCTGSSGAVTILSSEGKTIGDGKNIGVIALKDQAVALVYADRMKKSGTENANTDSICGLSVYDFSNQRLLGFDMRSTVLWTYNLPQGMPKRPIDYVTAADILPNGDSLWIALGSDGSVHLIDRDGILIDRFNHGRYIYGLTHARWNGKNVLILSDDQGVKAYEIIWK